MTCHGIVAGIEVARLAPELKGETELERGVLSTGIERPAYNLGVVGVLTWTATG